MEGSGENPGRTKSCPFWKDECRRDCMLLMSSAEKMTTQCAVAVIASQVALMVTKQKKF